MMNKKNTLLIGCLTFVSLLIFAALFYKERSVFLDLSFHLFEILRTRTFAIQNYRISAFFTQLFPVLGANANLPLNTIAFWYSESFLLLYFITFLVIIFALKNTRTAIAYFLFVVLVTTHTFYWIQSELPQSAAFLFLLFAVLDNALQRKYNKIFLASALLILSTLVVFGHPLLLFAFVFMTLFLAISYPQKMKFLAISSLPYFVIYGIKNLFFKTEYDKQAMHGLKNFVTLFPNYFTIESNNNFLHNIAQDYALLLLLFAAVCGFYAVQKNYLKLSVVLLFFFGYLLLINVSNAQGAPQFYIENQYLPLAVFAGIPFVFDVLPLAKPSMQKIIVSAVAITCVFRIYNVHTLYTNRVNWFRTVLSKTENLPHKKIIYSSEIAPLDTVLMTWASSYEFWLLSTLETDKSRSIIIDDKLDEFDWAIQGNKRHFITRWGVFDYNSLDKNYFHFSDTTDYVKIGR